MHCLFTSVYFNKNHKTSNYSFLTHKEHSHRKFMLIINNFSHCSPQPYCLQICVSKSKMHQKHEAL